MKPGEFIKTSLVGVGQIFLQDNGWAGLLITIGMAFSDWTLGVTCILGSMVGTITANVLKYKKEDILFGLYGFNGSLAYMCAMFTFGLSNGTVPENATNPIVWIVGLVSAILATMVMHVFVKNGKVAFTFPFVVTCWFTCHGLAQLGLFGLTQTTPALPDYTATMDAVAHPFFGWAEVNFGANFINGILIFLGIAIANPPAAMWSTAAATVGALFAHYIFGVDANTLANGIYSFSPILVACAFVGPKFQNYWYVIIGVLLAVIIHYVVVNVLNWNPYTFGFILASWIMLIVKKAVEGENGADFTSFTRALNP